MTQIGDSYGEAIPSEVMAVMPRDPYDQLDLAKRITCLAISSQVSKLEAESVDLRAKVSEKDNIIAELKERLLEFDRVFKETDGRLREALQENIKLAKERDSLAQTSKRLARDVQKLETFKRQLMQSLRNDNSSEQETIDITTCDQSIPKAPSSGDGASIIRSVSSVSVTGSTEIGHTTQEGARTGAQKFLSPYITPRLTPNATPKITSTVGSPKVRSGATSLNNNKPRFEGRMAMTPWFPLSKQSSTANSPPHVRPITGQTARIDGKEFFRQARSRLSYEQFGAFLANIKELNAHKQSREETLKKAQEIFGLENKDLYLSFHGLLTRDQS